MLPPQPARAEQDEKNSRYFQVHRERDSILFRTLVCEDCGVLGGWIFRIIANSLSELVTVNENRDRERQDSSQQRDYAQLPQCATSLCHGVGMFTRCLNRNRPPCNLIPLLAPG